MIALLNWTIQGDIEAGYGIVGIVIGLGLGVLAMSPPEGSEFMGPVAAGAVVVTVALFIPLRGAFGKRALAAIDADAIARAYDQLDERPNNVGAKFKIAKLIYARGLQGHAIKLAEEALKGMPPDFFGEEHKLVDMWKRQALPSSTFKDLPCVECGTNNPPGELYCSRCGSKFLLDQARGRWIGRAMARKLIAGWVALLGVFIGMPISAKSLPPAAALVAIVGLAVLIITTLYAAFFGSRTPGRA